MRGGDFRLCCRLRRRARHRRLPRSKPKCLYCADCAARQLDALVGGDELDDGCRHFTDFRLVLREICRRFCQALDDNRKDALRYGSECRREGKLYLRRLHLHDLHVQREFVHFFRIKPDALDARRRLGGFRVLLQRLREGKPPRSKRRHEKFLLHARIFRQLVAFGKVFQLLVERQDFPARIRQAHAEQVERTTRLLARLTVREKGLVKAHDRRAEGVHVATRELQDTRELACFCRRHVQAIGQLVDIVSRLHRAVDDTRKPECSGSSSRHALKPANEIARFLRYAGESGGSGFHRLSIERRLHGALCLI